MNLRIFLFILILSVADYCYAQSIRVTATTDKKSILIGEQLLLTLQMSFPQNSSPTPFQFDTIPHFEVLKTNKIDSSLDGRTLTLKQTFLLTSWDSGKWQIPSFALPNSNRTTPIPITVAFSPSPFDTNQEYHDIKDIIPVSDPKQPEWWWYLIGAILLLLLLMLVFPSKKKKQTSEFVPDAGIYKNSLHRLDKLKKESNALDDKQVYTELINIFREYLQKRKNIYSYSKTTDDLIVQISQMNLSDIVYTPLMQTLRLSDLVKFAKLKTGHGENQTSIDMIRQSIIAIENVR
jgi:hypothetical protein